MYCFVVYVGSCVPVHEERTQSWREKDGDRDRFLFLELCRLKDMLAEDLLIGEE